jgi:Ca2+/H+ antiporter, TMEM165/GDT1 family
MIDLSLVALAGSFAFVVLAEMGDKTQLLAMSFATRYNAYKVLLAVFIATIANHALAVLTGQFLVKIVPVDIISFIASISFIGFGLWTIRGDQLKGEDKKISRFGPVATVAIAFFIAEFGDKTQLATISLAVEYQSAISVLIGTTLGMIVADGIGIVVGIVLAKRIPERTIKWISASIFIIFGLVGVYEILSDKVGLLYTLIVTVALAVFSIWAAYQLKKANKNPKTNAIQSSSKKT